MLIKFWSGKLPCDCFRAGLVVRWLSPNRTLFWKFRHSDVIRKSAFVRILHKLHTIGQGKARIGPTEKLQFTAVTQLALQGGSNGMFAWLVLQSGKEEQKSDGRSFVVISCLSSFLGIPHISLGMSQMLVWAHRAMSHSFSVWTRGNWPGKMFVKPGNPKEVGTAIVNRGASAVWASFRQIRLVCEWNRHRGVGNWGSATVII